MNGIIFLTLLFTLLVLGGSYFIKTRGTIEHSNTGKGSNLWLFYLLMWVAILSVLLLALPPRKDVVTNVLLVWFFAAGLFWLVYFVRVYKFSPQPASIMYVPLYIKAWFFYASAPAVLKTRTTAMLKLGLVEKTIDMGMKVDSERDLEKQLAETQVIRLGKYSEEAMVESDILRSDHSLTIRVTAPGFHSIPEIQTSIDDMLNTPINILALPDQDGDYIIQFDFFDKSHKRCGGFVLPVVVRERSPLFSQQALRVVQIAAAVLGMAAGLKMIIEVLITAF